MVAVVVLPVAVNVFGVLLTVHVPAGRLLSTTLPVASVHVGCVMAPTSGFNGVCGCVLITMFAVASEVQPSELITVNVYVPAVRPLTVNDTVLPVVVIPPGLRIKVHVPDGNPLNSTEPVASEQVGCMIFTEGVAGFGLGSLIPLPARLVQPLMVVVTVNVPAVFTVIDGLVSPVLHKRSPVAFVERVEVPPQLFTTVTSGEAGNVSTVNFPLAY